jgi:enoyl-CoA hydratase/carnithine racemase
VQADEALQIGPVDRVVPPADLVGAVRGYAGSLPALSGNSQVIVKRMARLVQEGTVEDNELSRDLRDNAVEHPLFAEGRADFLAKRSPRFS